jgi:hypothetical protein
MAFGGLIAMRRLRRFLAHSFQTRSYERFDGLSIARIDASVEGVDTWIPAALRWLAAARRVRDEARYPLGIGVTFALAESDKHRGVSFRSAAELARELAEPPPVLGFVPPDAPYLEDAVPVHPGVFGLDPAEGYEGHLHEWSLEDGSDSVWYRSVLLHVPRREG